MPGTNSMIRVTNCKRLLTRSWEMVTPRGGCDKKNCLSASRKAKWRGTVHLSYAINKKSYTDLKGRGKGKSDRKKEP